MDYKKEFQRRYNEKKEFFEDISIYDFIEDDVFEFITYDSGEGSAQRHLCVTMIDVIKSIINRTTFEYQEKSDENYINFITMVNMPFLKNKLSWGSSIRGCWFDCHEHDNNNFIFFRGEDSLIVSEKNFINFLNDLIEWFEENN